VSLADEKALAQAKAGDREAWNVLVDAHAGAVWSAVARAGLAPEDAAQVCELTWLRLAQSLPELRPGLPLRDWLVAVAAAESGRAARLRRRHGSDGAGRGTGSAAISFSRRRPLGAQSGRVAKKLA
jgi:DNA-directed RNA polymerase specialized sigma24 family protein